MGDSVVTEHSTTTPGVKPLLAAWQPGWWDTHVDPKLNPVETVQLVDDLTAGLHPALPELRLIAKWYERAMLRRTLTGGPTYRCSKCHDVGLVDDPEDPTGRHTLMCSCRPSVLAEKGPSRAGQRRKVSP